MTDEEILTKLLRVTDRDTLQKAIREHNLQSLYEAQRKRMVTYLFNQSQLAFSTTMARIFGQFNAVQIAINAPDMLRRIKHLKRLIRTRRRMHLPDNVEWVTEANNLIAGYNEIMKPTKYLIRLHKKANQS